jgi:hypothetical protein
LVDSRIVLSISRVYSAKVILGYNPGVYGFTITAYRASTNMEEDNQSPFKVTYIPIDSNLVTLASTVVSSSAATPFATTIIKTETPTESRFPDEGQVIISGLPETRFNKVDSLKPPDVDLGQEEELKLPQMPITPTENVVVEKFSVRREHPQTTSKQPADVKKPTPKEIILNPVFKLALITSTGLTLLTFVTAISLSFVEPANTNIVKAIEVCWSAFTLGFGAIVGLIGGKSI